MAKVEERAVDSGIAEAKAKDEAALVEWWKERFTKLANIPTEAARAGALLPQMRELSRLPEPERRRLTKARMQAFIATPADRRSLILSARKVADATDPMLVKSDDAVADGLVSEVPGAADFRKQLE